MRAVFWLVTAFAAVAVPDDLGPSAAGFAPTWFDGFAAVFGLTASSGDSVGDTVAAGLAADGFAVGIRFSIAASSCLRLARSAVRLRVLVDAMATPPGIL